MAVVVVGRFGFNLGLDPDPPAAGSGGVQATLSRMTEVERRAYIKEHVVLENLSLGPDQKPEDEGPVPGLLRVSGTIRNEGARRLSEAHLNVYPEDKGGRVVTSYVEEILEGRGLGSGEARNFIFRIPARPEFSGEFTYRLR